MRIRGLIVVGAVAAIAGGLAYWLGSSRPEPARTEAPLALDSPGQPTPSHPVSDAPASAPFKPRSTATDEPAEVSESKPAALEIEIVGPKGSPAAHARLVLIRSAEVLGAATTDALGLAIFASGEGEAGILIVPRSAPRHETTVSIAPGRRRIALPAGVSIAGRVEINGAPPTEVVRLSADCQDIPWGERSPAVWKALNADPNATLMTTASGTFEMEGLKPGSDWKFGIRSAGYLLPEILADGRPVFQVTAPASDVLIRLSRVPVIRGRVVMGPERAPVPRAGMNIALQSTLSGLTRGDHAKDDGRFEFAAINEFEPTQVLKRITIEIQGPAGAGKKTVVVDPVPDHDLDLGDVEIPAGRRVRFRVSDSAGTPVIGALARLARGEVDPATRTDERGIGTILVPPDVTSMTVGALRHEAVEVQIPDPVPDPVPVVLPSAAGLEILVLSNDQTPAKSVQVRVSAQVRHMWGIAGTPFSDPISVAAGAAPLVSGSSGDLGSSSGFEVPPDGRVIVSGLRPGVPLTVAVLDKLEHELARATATLSAAEWKTMELRLTATARSLTGRVRNAAGEPIAGARVSSHSDPEFAGSRCQGFSPVAATTDASGRFVLNGIFGGPMHLAVDKKGWVPLVRRDFPTPEGRELDLVLETGFTLTVNVAEADGTPIRDLSISASTPGYPAAWCQENKGPGTYVFADFPKYMTATISTQWAAKTWTRTVQVNADTVETITMPAAGKLEVDYAAIEGEAFIVELRAPDLKPGFRPNWLFEVGAPASPRKFVASPVLPGDYEAALFQVRPRDDGTLAAPLVPVTIRAGETTRVVLRKR
jgi:hypothetical protein